VSRRISLALVVVLALVPAGCLFGGDMTAEKLEERLSSNSETALGLTKYENVHCREASVWQFECTFTLEQGLVSKISSEMAMGFNFDGDDVECGTGPQPVASGLPAPSEICPQMAR
jgi:hypothetical protein